MTESIEILGIIKKLSKGYDLAFEESFVLFNSMLQGLLTEGQMGAALSLLALKKETGDELAGAIGAIDNAKTRIQLDKMDSNISTIDIVGTGGDGKNCINISTITSITTAYLGEEMDLGVVKHGNVAQSGHIGSADILRLNGIPMDFANGEGVEYFNKNNFIFLFAANYHKALKYAGKVRREIRIPTIINMVGPFVSPANPTYQTTGTYSLEKFNIIKGALNRLKRDNIAVFYSKDGYDEVSSFAPTVVYEVKNSTPYNYEINPQDFFQPFSMPVLESEQDGVSRFIEALKGTNSKFNKIIALNTALALKVANRFDTIGEGFEVSIKALESGNVYKKFESLKGF